MNAEGLNPPALADLSHVAQDSRAVERARAGDPQAWATWHDAFYPVIYRYALTRLGSPEDAEDVASQVFLEAMKSIKRYRERGQPILAWFYGIARHIVSRRRRDRGRTVSVSDDVLDQAVDTEDGESSVANRLAIWNALDRLKLEQREVLVLRYLLELPAAEVAAMLGRSEAATHSLQTRALSAMKRQLTK